MKRLISILLAVMLVASCAVVASAYGWEDPDILTVDEAVADHESLYGEEVATNRYYFLMPNGKNGDLGDDDSVDEVTGEPLGHYGEFAPTWFVEWEEGKTATATAGIYWWDSGVADPAAWVGYLPSGQDENDPYVFYADVPQAATTIIWNNAVDGGMDSSQPIYYCAAQSINIPSEYYDPGESPNYPDGTESFDNMIFVIDPDLISINELSLKQTCGGEWYYYYGNGCYGFTPDGTEADCCRDDHFDEEGNHVIPEHDPIPEPVLPKVEPTFVLGDVDGDGVVSVMDATEIQMVLAQMKEWAYDQAEAAADFDGDGVASVMDATEIQMVQAGLK